MKRKTETSSMEDVVVVSDDNESRKDDVVEDELRMEDDKEVDQDESVVAEEYDRCQCTFYLCYLKWRLFLSYY
jgi:hypothetical protein